MVAISADNGYRCTYSWPDPPTPAIARAQQRSVLTAVFGEFHRPVASLPPLATYLSNCSLSIKPKTRHHHAPIPTTQRPVPEFPDCVLAFLHHAGVVVQPRLRLFLLPFFTVNSISPLSVLWALSGSRHIPARRCRCDRGYVTTSVIGHQFRVHLCQPGFILGDVYTSITDQAARLGLVLRSFQCRHRHHARG